MALSKCIFFGTVICEWPRAEAHPSRVWRSAAGREPVREWLNELSREDKRAIGRDIAKLPSKREARVFFGFRDGILIAVHAMIKKTQKTPAEDPALARLRFKDLQSWPRKTRT